METKNTEHGKVIGNISVLDIRKATEESTASIRRIGNVGTLIYSPETIGFIPRLNMGNLGTSIEAPADAKIVSGQIVFGPDYFKHQVEPLSMLVSGQLIVHPDVPAEDIEKGLRELVVTGRLICPEHLEGAIQAKLRNFIGQIQTYTQSSRTTIGTLILDENYLRSLEDGAEIAVIGNLNLPKVLPNDLLAQKIRRIQVTGRLVCREENAQTLFACLDDKMSTPRTTIIPEGFELVEKPLVIDTDLLEALPARKLYCTNMVQIARNVTSEALDSRLEALVVKDIVVCPASLKEVISRKCNMLETEVVFYEGELWLVDDKLTLLKSHFDYLKDKPTLVVNGKLTIAPDIDPQMLVERLAKIHNFGKILCTPDKMGAIQSLLGINDGKLQTEEEREEQGEEGIGNVGHLAL